MVIVKLGNLIYRENKTNKSGKPEFIKSKNKHSVVKKEAIAKEGKKFFLNTQ
jgi:hypothetical protein